MDKQERREGGCPPVDKKWLIILILISKKWISQGEVSGKVDEVFF